MDSNTWNGGRRRRTPGGGYYHRDDDLPPTTAQIEGAFSSTASPIPPDHPVPLIDLNRSPPPDATYHQDPRLRRRGGSGTIPVADDDSIDLNRTPPLEISHDSNHPESYSSNVVGITGATAESRRETREQTQRGGSMSPTESSTKEIVSPHPRIFGTSFVPSKPRS